MSTAAPVQERRRPMEEMSKEELIAMFQKVRTQTLQIAREKKTAVENFEICSREKDEIRGKAIAVVQRYEL
jgi:arsenate reductase-like glutaredoxin family protein